MRIKRENFAEQVQIRKQAAANTLAKLEENAKNQKQSLLNSLSQVGTQLSEKKAAQAREQNLLQHALKKQEDQLSCDIQPLKNQIADLKNRLEQDRSAREKQIHTKEQALNSMEQFHHNQFNQSRKNLKREALEYAKTFQDIRKNSFEETTRLENDIANHENECRELEFKLARLPKESAEEMERLHKTHNNEIEKLRSIHKDLTVRSKQESRSFQDNLKDYDERCKTSAESLKILIEKHTYDKHEKESKFKSAHEMFKKKIQKLEQTVLIEKTDLENAIGSYTEKIDTLIHDLDSQKEYSETERTRCIQQWKEDKKRLEDDITNLQKDFESQKSIWKEALNDRSTVFQHTIWKMKTEEQRHNTAFSEYEKEQNTYQDELANSVLLLEAQLAKVREESIQKQKEKKSEYNRLQTRLDEFLSRSKNEEAKRNIEITQQRSELENQRDTAKRKFKLEARHWPEIIQQKDSEIGALKSELSLKETSFRSEWEKAERNFENFKGSVSERIKNLQKHIYEERNSVEFRVREQEREIQKLKETISKEDSSSRESATNVEDAFNKVKHTLESEISDLTAKQDQERKRSEQIIKVKEIEITSIRRNLGQRELQKNQAKETHLKEIAQERARLIDWQNALEARLLKEKISAEGIIQSKAQELNALKERLSADKERFQSEQSAKQQEIMESKTRMELHIKELSIALSISRISSAMRDFSSLILCTHFSSSWAISFFCFLCSTFCRL